MPPGHERRITAIRQPAVAHALVLRVAGEQVAIISLDMLGVSTQFSRDVARRIAAQTGIPAENVRICVTHTHSMPAFFYLRQWGAEPKQYESDTADQLVQAAVAAHQDLGAAECYLGHSRVEGGNFNRTTPSWKTDVQFDQNSTADTRWLDTQLHVLRFGAGRPDVLWYHFSAHPVCYADGEAGPDWVGIAAELVRQKLGVSPAFLQGHCGDVNPGGGEPWRGNAECTAFAVADAIKRTIQTGVRQPVEKLRTINSEYQAPLNIELLEQQLHSFENTPKPAPVASGWMKVSPKTGIRMPSTGI